MEINCHNQDHKRGDNRSTTDGPVDKASWVMTRSATKTRFKKVKGCRQTERRGRIRYRRFINSDQQVGEETPIEREAPTPYAEVEGKVITAWIV